MTLQTDRFVVLNESAHSVAIANQHAYRAPDNDSKATVKAAGYFNNVRNRLEVGHLILCDCDENSNANARTTKLQLLRAVTVPATGNVTTEVVWEQS